MKKLEILQWFRGFDEYLNNLITRSTEGFRVSAKIRRRQAHRKRRVQRKLAERQRRAQRQLAARRQRIRRRLERSGDGSRPLFAARSIQYEIAGRTRAISCGGIGTIHLLARQLGLIDAIDDRLHLLQIHRPYHESDHVLNFAYNALCDGTCLDDIELRRNDEVFLDALAAERIPDPTTAGDFCRRFAAAHVQLLQDIFNDVRLKVWAQQPAAFFQQARIDLDGTLVPTNGACKAGMDIAYNGTWGYHPLVVSLANTNEVLSIINRSGNRPSYEGAAVEVDRAIAVCIRGGFRSILLRGDTDFTQTKHLDRWSADPRVQFIFGMDAQPNLHLLADDLPASAWQRLQRPPRYQVQTQPRRRPHNFKERIVVAREFKNIRLVSEQVAEFTYRPTACGQSYRLVVVRKNLSVEQGAQVLFADYRYFFYLTNDHGRSAAAIVFAANDRCNQENLHAQLKHGVRALQAPVDNLVSNWAYMVMTALAWNLKAWWALTLPEAPGRWHERHRAEKQTVLTMEFKTFLNAFVRLPCQIIRTGRRLVYRLLSWNPWHPVFFRVCAVLRC
jgi:Transposase DDE domain group 1